MALRKHNGTYRRSKDKKQTDGGAGAGAGQPTNEVTVTSAEDGNAITDTILYRAIATRTEDNGSRALPGDSRAAIASSEREAANQNHVNFVKLYSRSCPCSTQRTNCAVYL